MKTLPRYAAYGSTALPPLLGGRLRHPFYATPTSALALALARYPRGGEPRTSQSGWLSYVATHYAGSHPTGVATGPHKAHIFCLPLIRRTVATQPVGRMRLARWYRVLRLFYIN